MTRRRWLVTSTSAWAGMVLAQLPLALVPRGLLDDARAAEVDVVRDTFQGLLAFMFPGDDEYSQAQGVTAPGPGGVASGGVDPLRATLDRLFPAAVAGTTVEVPISNAVAVVLDAFALEVDPLAAGGPLLSPFARLSFRDKAEVFRRFEADEIISGVVAEVRYLVAVLLAIVAYYAYSEGGVLGPDGLERTPVGWALTGYPGPVDGHADLRGYYRGRTAAGA